LLKVAGISADFYDVFESVNNIPNIKVLTIKSVYRVVREFKDIILYRKKS